MGALINLIAAADAQSEARWNRRLFKDFKPGTGARRVCDESSICPLVLSPSGWMRPEKVLERVALLRLNAVSQLQVDFVFHRHLRVAVESLN